MVTNFKKFSWNSFLFNCRALQDFEDIKFLWLGLVLSANWAELRESLQCYLWCYSSINLKTSLTTLLCQSSIDTQMHLALVSAGLGQQLDVTVMGSLFLKKAKGSGWLPMMICTLHFMRLSTHIPWASTFQIQNLLGKFALDNEMNVTKFSWKIKCLMNGVKKLSYNNLGSLPLQNRNWETHFKSNIRCFIPAWAFSKHELKSAQAIREKTTKNNWDRKS